MEHEGNGDTSCTLCTRYGHQGTGTRTGELGNKRKNRDNPNYSIIKIDQNTKMSLGDLRRLAVT